MIFIKQKKRPKKLPKKQKVTSKGLERKSESDEEKTSPVMKNEIELAQWNEETKLRDVKDIEERNTREATEGLTRDVDISSEFKPSETKWRIKKESEK